MKFIVFKLNTLKKICLIFILLGVVSLNFDNGSIAGVYFGQTIKKVPIYSVQTDKKVVAISFDAAWGSDKTEKILEILNEFEVKATFFLVGFWAESNAGLVTEIDEQGFEIGTHSNTHPDMTKLDRDTMINELTTSKNILSSMISQEIQLFRAPYGSYNNTLLEVAEELSLTTIQWSLDSHDWMGISTMEITTRIINKVQNGSIILFHNNSDNILDALPICLDRLQKQGYKITSIGDLIYSDNYTVNFAGVQIKNN